MKKALLLLLSFFSILNYLDGQSQKTFCNPVNIDYGYTPIPDFSEAGRHRATADPVIVNYKGDYYLFSTNQWGYWWSNDLLKWNYISRRFLRQWNKGYDELCAPAVGIIGDTMLVFGSTYTSEFTIVDEDIKTYWSAATGNSGEWIQSDLGSVCTVRAIQINYADQDAGVLGKSLDVYHQYRILGSKDGRRWNVLVDKSLNKTDVPHDYIELESPVQTRFLKLENIHMPTGKFSISGFRVFGKGIGEIPEAVNAFTVLRTEKDKRSAWLKWYPVDNAYAYNIYFGIAPDKLYNCIMVYNANEYWLKALDKEKPCFFSIEALNENGVGERSQVIKSD